MLVRPIGTLCGECHNVESESFADAHLEIDPKVMNCMTCHAPHSSKDPKLFLDKGHAPFAARSCDVCHMVPSS